jgi:hypothetical protein
LRASKNGSTRGNGTDTSFNEGATQNDDVKVLVLRYVGTEIG